MFSRGTRQNAAGSIAAAFLKFHPFNFDARQMPRIRITRDYRTKSGRTLLGGKTYTVTPGEAVTIVSRGDGIIVRGEAETGTRDGIETAATRRAGPQERRA